MWGRKYVILLLVNIYLVSTEVMDANRECRIHPNGIYYTGTTAQTESGLTCQRWDQQKPHDHHFNFFLGRNASEHQNYCRNPDFEMLPWCYTVDENVRFQFCDIPLCVKECKDTPEGGEYKGTTNVTKDGDPCQRWDSDSPHVHNWTTLEENYCRNPDGKPAPWCYTMNPGVHSQFCDIPFCFNSSFKCDGGIEPCSLRQRRDWEIQWTSSNEGPSRVYHLASLANEATTLPILILPRLRYVSTGSCIHLEYKSEGIKLLVLLTEDAQFYTLLTESSVWKSVKVNIRPESPLVNYEVLIAPEFPSASSLNATIKSISVDDKFCEDCHSCLGDGLCIESAYLCDLVFDCVDGSDEENCEKECKDTPEGKEYRGTVNVTKNGIPCQRWERDYPHAHNYKGYEENYCRNPDGEPTLWCYTTNPDVRWQICDVPFCFNSSMRCDDGIEPCSIEQIQDSEMRWSFIQSNEGSSSVYHLISFSNITTTQLPTLKFPRLRFVSTGSCIHLDYRSDGIQLKLSTTTKTLTLLKESSVWKSVKVNIRPESGSISYEVRITPVSSSSSSFNATIRFISVLDKFCEECFPCLNDGLCIENSKFCDLRIDCPDLSDEKNCAFECYHKNYYAGFRKETSSLQQCVNNGCIFGQMSRGTPGCLPGIKKQWEPCSIPECETESLSCNFEDNMCGWRQMLGGLKWRRQTDTNTGELFALSERVSSNVNESLENRAVLYSTIQPVSTDFGCITMKYSGHNVNFKVFLTNDTIFDQDELVFHHQSVHTDIYISTSFQTPTDTPYMVIVDVLFGTNSSSTIRLLDIQHQTGICEDRGPCSIFQFQCSDGNCIDNINVCDNTSHCPEKEDELSCEYKSNACHSCLEALYECPTHCSCQKLVFKCDSLQNVSKEARALDLSSSRLDVLHLRNFSFLVHLNLSACFTGNVSLKNLGKQLGSNSLQSLDISYNNIYHLENSVFVGMQKLLYLNISNNCINNLALDFLTIIPKLRYLISKNSQIEIIRLNDNKYEFNTSLERIDLTGNRILKIEPGSIYFLHYVTRLILRDNYIANTDNYFSDSQKMLTYIDLKNNSIHTITNNMFVGLSKLKELNLENNDIEILDNFAFYTLISLRVLNLAFNKIHTIRKRAMENLASLTHLNLTGNVLLKLQTSRFVPLIKLQVLDLSKNGLKELGYNAFKRLEEVKYLYIQENELTISKTMFQGLCNLEWLWTDSYIICCAKPLSVDTSKCISPRDNISSCEQLISIGFLGQMIWFMALFSFVGNLYVIFYRIRNVSRSRSVSQEIFILNLSFSDFLMGVYLFIIAIADLRYRNVYGFNDGPWRSSAICTLAGLLATISSEASVLFVFLITVERFIVLKYPFSLTRFKSKKSTHCVTILVWVIAVGLAAVPLSFYPDFYSRSTVCISLPLTSERVHGWEYSTFVFIGFNLLVFIAVVLGQILIYAEVKRIGNTIPNDTTKREVAVFKSLSYVVLSDTFCWIPIILIGLLAHGGVQISSDVYAWVVVLVLPINSALNPFIYTFSMIYKKQKWQPPRSQEMTGNTGGVH